MTTRVIPHCPVVPRLQECFSHSRRAAQCTEARWQSRASHKEAVSERQELQHTVLLCCWRVGPRNHSPLQDSWLLHTYYFAYMAQCTALFAFTVFHLIWGCNNNFFHDYDVFFLPFTIFNAGRKREQMKVTSCRHPTSPAEPKFPAHHSGTASCQQPLRRRS